MVKASSNFEFLLGSWAVFKEDALEAEAHAMRGPRTAAFYARRGLEKGVKWCFANDAKLREPYQDNLAALIHEPSFGRILPPGLFSQIRLIHQVGNQAVHTDISLRPQDGLKLVRALHHFYGWMVRTYSKDIKVVPPFSEALLREEQSPAPDKNAGELEALQQQFSAKDKAFEQSQKELADTTEELERLRGEVQAIRETNEKKLQFNYSESEAETRDLFIDVLLREAGWNPESPNVREYEVEGMPNTKGVGYVDYVLWGDDGLPLAVVEAKRTKRDPREGKRQAELYADCLEKMKGQRPVIYYTNGYETWLWDDTHYPPRSVQGFANKDELQLMVNRRASRKGLASISINKDITGRYYQEEALKRLADRFGKDHQREALFVMATGTGKTRVSISAVDMLMKANYVRRVLFLADRTALVNQAKRAFNAHLPHVSLVNLVNEKEDDSSRIAFSTYHTMMNLIDDTKRDGERRFGSNYFDLIIIDEAHRSVYQKFSAIFDYFDALLLGLTATPKSEVDRNTYHLFNLEDNVPTYAYELEQAVADEFLVPPKPVAVSTKFLRQGVKYDELSEAEKEEYESSFFDEETNSVPKEIDAAALNAWLFNEDTVEKVLANLMESGLKIEGGDKLGKTIVFAKNHLHAQFIVEQFDKYYPHYAGKFCQLIDNSVEYAQSLIDDFTLAEKHPTIAVSVDMLDTGIDVPEVVNLVFFKPVRAKSKFWQMIGRGTRLCEDLFGPEMDKEFFMVFDYCENLKFFSANPDGGREAGAQESVKQKIFKRRLELAMQLQELGEKDAELEGFQAGLLDEMHTAVRLMNMDHFTVRPKRRIVEMFLERERWNHLTKTDALDIDENLTGLPVPDDDDEFSRRFDLLIYNLQLAMLEKSPRQQRYREQIQEIAQGLAEKQTIPAVKKEIELILDLQSEAYWECTTLPMLDDVRRRLRHLIRFVDKGERRLVYTDFEDELGEVTNIEGLVKADPSLKNYRLKVESFIRENQKHITIKRLRENEPVTAKDLEGLEAILFSDTGAGSKEQFFESYGEQPLGEFIRKIVGLDRNAAKQAFAAFLDEGNLSADQIRFIDLIIDHLVQNGVMDIEELYNPPFTDIHDLGIDGIFPKRAGKIVGVIKAVNERSKAA